MIKDGKLHRLVKSGIVLALLLVLSLTVACSSSKEVKLGAADDGQKIEITKGQIIAISLDSNPSTGYSWEASDLDESILSQEGESEFKSEAKPNVVGAGGVETLRFKAVETGETMLKLIYHRSWEKDVAPEQTFTVQVTVR